MAGRVRRLALVSALGLLAVPAIGTGQANAEGLLTVTVVGKGDVTAGGIDCDETGGPDCTQFITDLCFGTPPICVVRPLTVTAAPDRDGFVFQGWTGDCSAGAPVPRECTVALTDDEFLTATFVDVTAPDTRIVDGPPKRTTRKRARFKLAAEDGSAVSFQCKLDDGAYEPCSKRPAFRVGKGRHQLRAFGVDAEDNTETSPAKYVWKVTRKNRR
jgi:uncharacterized repeat protein (TIGR02543 family)